MKIAVVGAGLSGLACASFLVERGFDVRVLEKEKDVGGLAGYMFLGGERFPKTYHHVLRSDKALSEALNRFKIPVEWKNVKIGLYTDSEILPVNGPLDLLKFSPLSPLDRLRLGFLVLNAKYDSSPRNITAKEWVSSKAGGKVFEKFVSPLLASYFGSSENIAASYLAHRWRDESIYASKVGYADFPRMIDSYVDGINRSGSGIIETFSTIREIEICGKSVRVTLDEVESYDAVVFTCPPPETRSILRGVSPELLRQLDSIDYRAYISLVLRLEEKTSKYYWINILDENIPFIACFEHGNLNPKLKGGLVYVIAYVDVSSALWLMEETAILERFKGGLRTIFNAIPEIKSWRLFRGNHGTPIYRVGYRNVEVNPFPRTYFAGVYRAFPEIRSSGASIRSGIEAAWRVLQDYKYF